MRFVLPALLLIVSADVTNQTSEKAKNTPRFNIDLDAKKYPQSTPKEALGSVLKAIGEKQFDYLLAHLVEPAFVDQRVAQSMSALGKGLTDAQRQSLAFDRLVKAIADAFLEDPTKLTELRKFHDEGTWELNENRAEGRLKGLEARKVIMQAVAPDRWVLLDRTK